MLKLKLDDTRSALSNIRTELTRRGSPEAHPVHYDLLLKLVVVLEDLVSELEHKVPDNKEVQELLKD